MTVRITKEPLNLRAKLAELEKPTGIKGEELMRANTSQDARDVISAGRRNKIINGAMMIDQRNGGSAITNSNGYAVDRFKFQVAGMDQFAASYQQVSEAPAGFAKSIKVTVTTPEGSIEHGEYHSLFQKMEGFNLQDLAYGTPDAKYVTISFYVKSSIPGKYGWTVYRNDTPERVINRHYHIQSPNTWERKSITIPGDEVNGITNDNAGRWWNIWHLASSGGYDSAFASRWTNYSSTNWVGLGQHENAFHLTNGATWQITGVQLEVGKNATEFEHRSYGEELALCQRYYQNSYHQSAGQYPGNTTADNGMIQTTWNDGNSPFGMFPTPMRAQPTVTLRPRGSSTTGQVANNNVNRSASAQQISNQGVGYLAVSSGSANTWCAFSYELNAEI